MLLLFFFCSYSTTTLRDYYIILSYSRVLALIVKGGQLTKKVSLKAGKCSSCSASYRLCVCHLMSSVFIIVTDYTQQLSNLQINNTYSTCTHTCKMYYLIMHISAMCGWCFIACLVAGYSRSYPGEPFQQVVR